MSENFKSEELPKKNPQSLSTTKRIDFSGVSANELRAEVVARSLQFYGKKRYEEVRDNMKDLIESRNVPVVTFSFFHQMLSLTGVSGHNVALALIMEWGLEDRISDFSEKFEKWLEEVGSKAEAAKAVAQLIEPAPETAPEVEEVASKPESIFTTYSTLFSTLSIEGQIKFFQGFEATYNTLSLAEQIIIFMVLLDENAEGKETAAVVNATPYMQEAKEECVKVLGNTYGIDFTQYFRLRSTDAGKALADVDKPAWGAEYIRLRELHLSHFKG